MTCWHCKIAIATRSRSAEELREIIGAAPAQEEGDHVPRHVRHRASRPRAPSAVRQEQGRHTDRQPHRRRAHQQGELPAARAAGAARDQSRRARMVDYVVIDRTPRRSRTSASSSPTISPRATNTRQGGLPSTTARGDRRRRSPTAARSSSRRATSSIRPRTSSRRRRRRSRSRSCMIADGSGRAHVRRSAADARRADGAPRARRRRHDRRQLHALRHDRRQTKTPTMSVLFESRTTIVGGAGDRRQALDGGRRRGRRSRRCSATIRCGFRARRSRRCRRRCARRSSIARGRRPTRMRSSPAATGCSRSTRSTTARSPISILEDARASRSGTRRPTPSCSAISATASSTARTIPELVAGDSRRLLPGRRQPGRQPLGQHPRVPGLRSDHAERARGALCARRPGLRSCGRSASSSIDASQLQDADPQARRARHDDLPRHPQQDRRTISFFVIDSFVDRVVDAVGAGDALLAYAALAHVRDRQSRS